MSIEPISLQWLAPTVRGEKIIYHIKPLWPTSLPHKSKTKVALEKLIKRMNDRDIKQKYVTLNIINTDKVEIIFNIKKWLNENFKTSGKIEKKSLTTLIWKWKYNLPNLVLSNTSWITLKNVLTKNFTKFLKENKNRLFSSKYKIWKKIEVNWLDIDTDIQWSSFYTKIKTKFLILLGMGIYAGYKTVRSK